MTPDAARLAAEALRLYGLKSARLARLGGIDNVNFRVDTETQAYALHLCAPRQTRAAVASELLWLGRLRRDLALNVPEPVPNRDGEWVSSVTLEGTETLCTLMRWLPGEVPPTVDAMTAGQLEEAGALMAQLHRHAQGFRVPEGFSRPTYGETHFRDRFRTLYRALQHAEFDRDRLEAFAADADAVLARFGGLGRTDAAFGLIHADFHSGNYVLNGDALSIIDFGRCGFGFYLHDLALALMELNDAQRESFLRGLRGAPAAPRRIRRPPRDVSRAGLPRQLGNAGEQPGRTRVYRRQDAFCFGGVSAGGGAALGVSPQRISGSAERSGVTPPRAAPSPARRPLWGRSRPSSTTPARGKGAPP